LGEILVNVRLAIVQHLKARAALITNSNAAYGMAVSVDLAEVTGANADAHFGLLLGNEKSQPLLNDDNRVVEFDGELEFIAYAHVRQSNKKDRAAYYQQLSDVREWVIRELQADPTLGGAVCSSSALGEWRTPVRGDAIESQPQVLSIAVYQYEGI
jgi:hypothetical protein